MEWPFVGGAVVGGLGVLGAGEGVAVGALPFVRGGASEGGGWDWGVCSLLVLASIVLFLRG